MLLVLYLNHLVYNNDYQNHILYLNIYLFQHAGSPSFITTPSTDKRRFLKSEKVSIDNSPFDQDSVAVVKNGTLYYCNYKNPNLLPNDFLPSNNIKENLEFFQCLIKNECTKLKGVCGFLCNTFGRYVTKDLFLESYGLIVVDISNKPLPKVLGYGTVSSNYYQRYGTDPDELIKKFDVKKIYYSVNEQRSPFIVYFETQAIKFFRDHQDKIVNISIYFILTSRRSTMELKCFLPKCKGNFCIACTMYMIFIKIFDDEYFKFRNTTALSSAIEHNIAKYTCRKGIHEFDKFILTVKEDIELKKTIPKLKYSPTKEANRYVPFRRFNRYTNRFTPYQKRY